MRLVLTVEINGGIPVECDFKGGKYFPYRENGTYRTNNKAIQEALEKHERYPGDFRIIKIVEDVKVKEPEKQKAEPEADKVIEVQTEETEDVTENLSGDPVDNAEIKIPTISSDGTVIVNEVKNSQDAKLYLNKNFDVPFSRMKNTEMVMKEATLANLNFPNWKL